MVTREAVVDASEIGRASVGTLASGGVARSMTVVASNGARSGPAESAGVAASFDVDLFDTAASTVAALQSDGRRVVCYINAGAWEDWRPDPSWPTPELPPGWDEV